MSLDTILNCLCDRKTVQLVEESRQGWCEYRQLLLSNTLII